MTVEEAADAHALQRLSCCAQKHHISGQPAVGQRPPSIDDSAKLIAFCVQAVCGCCCCVVVIVFVIVVVGEEARGSGEVVVEVGMVTGS